MAGRQGGEPSGPGVARAHVGPPRTGRPADERRARRGQFDGTTRRSAAAPLCARVARQGRPAGAGARWRLPGGARRAGHSAGAPRPPGSAALLSCCLQAPSEAQRASFQGLSPGAAPARSPPPAPAHLLLAFWVVPKLFLLHSAPLPHACQGKPRFWPSRACEKAFVERMESAEQRRRGVTRLTRILLPPADEAAAESGPHLATLPFPGLPHTLPPALPLSCGQEAAPNSSASDCAHTLPR